MPEDRTDNPFFLEAGLDVSQLKNAVTAAEKFYLSFSKSMGKVIEGLETQEEQHEKTGEAAKNAAEEEEKSSKKKVGLIQQIINKVRGANRKERKEVGETNKIQKERFKIAKKVGRGIGGILKREKEAVSGLGISWGGLATLIGGATVIGLIGKAMKDYLEFDKQIRELNITLSTQPRLLKAASGAIQGLTGYLDMSREELVQITKQIGELHMIKDNTAAGAKAFRRLTLDVIHLSKSMDVSGDSVVGLFDNFTRVYKLPHHRLRNIAASMKFIQEQTSISGQELISFAEGLEDITSRMIRTTGEGAAKATVDLMAMAGVLKEMGVQPQKVSQMFGEAMKLHSEQGAQFLAFIAEGTEKTPEQLRKMMQAGDMRTPFTMLIERLKKESPEMLEHYEETFGEMTGLTFAEMRNLQQANTQGLGDLYAQNEEAYKKGQKHAEEAAKRQHKLSAMWNSLKRVAESAWLRIGGVLVTVATKVSEVLMPALEGMMKKLDDWLSSTGGAKAIEEWTKRTITWFRELVIWISSKLQPALLAVGQFFDKYLKEKLEWFLSPEGGAALTKWFDDALDTIKSMAKGIKGIADFIGEIKEALKTDEERAKEWAQSQEEILERSHKSFEKHIATRLKEGGKFEFDGIQMEATQGNIKAFMGKVAQKQIADFAVGISRYDVPDELKAELMKTWGKELMIHQKVGYEPTKYAMAERGGGESKGQGTTYGTSLPAAPGRVPIETAKKIPPTTVKTPEVEVKVQKQSPLQVSVKTENQASEKLLAEIRDALQRILSAGRGHASRTLLQQQ